MATENPSRLTEDDKNELQSIYCTPCRDDGDDSVAGHYCVDCELYLCGKCMKYHKKFPSTKSHQVNDVECNRQNLKVEAKKQVENKHLTPRRLRCNAHNGKIIHSYCNNHEELCCETCALFKHRNCKVEEISVKAKGFKSSPEIKRYEDSLSKVMIDLNQEIEVRTKNLVSIEKDKINMLKAVDKNEEEMIAGVTNLAEMSRKQIRDKYEDHKKAIDTDVGVMRATVTTVLEYADKITETNEEKLFVNIQTSKQFRKESEELLQGMSSGWRKRKISFSFDKETKESLLSRESFGKIVDGYKNLLYNATLRSRFDCRDVFDVCMIKSGEIFIIDKSNNSLKRYTSGLELKETIEIPQHPVAVCPVSINEVAVRSQDDGNVHLISVQETMKVVSSFKVEPNGFGMTYDITEEEYFICENAKVSVYSKSGNRIRAYEKDTTTGQTIFAQCRQISVDPERKFIYVTDLSIGLIVLYKSGNVKCILKDFKTPWALCQLPGDVFLVGDTYRSSTNLMQVNKSGDRHGLLQTNGHAYCVVYDRVRNRLIVGGNLIYVYELSISIR